MSNLGIGRAHEEEREDDAANENPFGNDELDFDDALGSS